MGTRPNSALIVVNPQNDFFPGGAWPISYADRIVPRLNEYIQLFWEQDLPIFVSRDWHSPDAAEFTVNGGHLPSHCVRDTWGAEFHPDLQLPKNAIMLTKELGDSEIRNSAFWGQDKRGHSLYDWLKVLQISWVYACGLPLETHVKATVIDALIVGARASILIDASRSRGSMPSDEEQAVMELVGRGVQMESISQLRK